MPVSVPAPVQSFLNHLKYEKRYSKHTLIAYQTDLLEFYAYLDSRFGPVLLTEINHHFIRSWLAGLKDQGITAKTITRKIASIRSFFKYQLKTGQIETSPAVGLPAPKIRKRLPVFMKENDSGKLIASLNQSAENWKSLNAKMLITIFYATGMRLSELIDLKTKQVDFSKSQIKVLGKGNKERVIPVSEGILNSIKEYQQLKNRDLETKNEFLLVTDKGKKLYPKYAYLLVNELLSGASTLDKNSPHVLRHTFATHLMDHGADLNAVKELLGHSSLASTQIYTHTTIEKLRDVHKKAHPKA